MRSSSERSCVPTSRVWMSLISAVLAIGCGGGGGGNITDPPPGGAKLYVSNAGDDNNPGTRALPMATINAAIQAAPASGADVFVGAGTYTESGSAPLNLRSKVNLHGGYDPATWTRDPATFPTILEGGGVATVSSISSSGADSLSIDGFTIVAVVSNAALVDMAGSVEVEISNNQFTVAKGADGLALDGPLAPGLDGHPGRFGSDAGECPVFGGAGGAGNPHRGGAGGLGGSAGGIEGGRGEGPDGGSVGRGGQIGADGTDGSNGGDGAPGTDGAGGAGFGRMFTNFYVPADGEFGGDGTDGSGAGGGGGGGGGGAKGRSPGFGFGGGASIAMMVRQDSRVSVHDNVITTGGGGKGGGGPAGKPGGIGGAGRPGGARFLTLAKGGDGGNGGDGGDGGAGGGGGGGPSIGVVLEEGSTLEQTGNTFNIGPAGTGGAGPGNRGADGEAAKVKQVGRPDPGPM